MSAVITNARAELQKSLDLVCSLLPNVCSGDGAAPLHQLCMAARNLANRLHVAEVVEGGIPDRQVQSSIDASKAARAIAGNWHLATE